jgi:hypothetical protein
MLINLQAKLFKIGSWTILELPKSASQKLPSRGLAMVKGTINGFPLQTTLEPDGKGSHWFRVSEAIQKGAKIKTGDIVELSLEPTKDWLDPKVPADFQEALMAHPKVWALWQKITPMAKWEWIRWIRATNRLETRTRRIEVALSKLSKGMRRPCCFNSSMCTEPTVSRNGVLQGPA